MYDVTFQTEVRYKSVKYGQGTIYSSACGPASLCNALKVLGIASVSLPTMCKLAVSCGARVTGGTDMHQLLRAASKKYSLLIVPQAKMQSFSRICNPVAQQFYTPEPNTSCSQPAGILSVQPPPRAVPSPYSTAIGTAANTRRAPSAAITLTL